MTNQLDAERMDRDLRVYKERQAAKARLEQPKAMNDGLALTFYPSGIVRSQSIINNGQPHGQLKQWHPNEQLWKLIHFNYGIRHGRSSSFNRDGRLELELEFLAGRLVRERRFKESGLCWLENSFGGK